MVVSYNRKHIDRYRNIDLNEMSFCNVTLFLIYAKFNTNSWEGDIINAFNNPVLIFSNTITIDRALI